MSHEVAEADQNLREIARLRAELDATSADLDTLRNGVAWLGGELDRVKAWAGLWKRAAKGQWNHAEWWRWRHGDVRRAARLLVVAWRGEKGRAEAWRMLAEEERGRVDRLSGAETNENSPGHPTV